jgi:hypothetical protein
VIAVVLEAGFGGRSGVWAEVQPQLGATTRTALASARCSFRLAALLSAGDARVALCTP